MKTVINFFIIILIYPSIYGQIKKNEPLYIEYDEKMIINDFDSKISLSFSINSSDVKVNTYNFRVDNLKEGFKTPKFNKIKDTISKINFSKIKKIINFSKREPYKLHLLFSDMKEIFLIKKVNKLYYKYKLIYWSTQRGWEPIKL